MKVIFSEADPALDSSVRGVELEGMSDALLLADRLNAFAQRSLVGEVSFGYSQGLEALRLQARLLRDLGTNAPGDPFGFAAEDRRSGLVLKTAAESDVDAETQAEILKTRASARDLGGLVIDKSLGLGIGAPESPVGAPPGRSPLLPLLDAISRARDPSGRDKARSTSSFFRSEERIDPAESEIQEISQNIYPKKHDDLIN